MTPDYRHGRHKNIAKVARDKEKGGLPLNILHSPQC